MVIKPYDENYRDDLIFMVLQAKDALGRKPRINEDLLDIYSSYFDRGDMFWIAIDENDRVIGCIGYNREPNANAAFLHRLYVKFPKSEKELAQNFFKQRKLRCGAYRISGKLWPDCHSHSQ